MPKENIGMGYRIKHFFIYHPWLKLVALALAIISWLYVKSQIVGLNY
jgi:hypothetical protein